MAQRVFEVHNVTGLLRNIPNKTGFGVLEVLQALTPAAFDDNGSQQVVFGRFAGEERA
jgi:hypothetical protein